MAGRTILALLADTSVPDPAVATARTTSTEVVQCLGGPWKARERIDRNLMNIDIERADREPYVSVRVRQARDKSWQLRIDVNEPDK